MIEIPFYNDFFSLISPKNKNEIIAHCLDSSIELPKEEFEWGEVCLSEKVSLRPTEFTELLKPYIIEALSEVVDVQYKFSVDEVWKNTYHRYYHQEQHDHHDFELSFVIFMNDSQENDAQFYFVNERQRVSSTNWSEVSTNLMADNCTIEEKKGDILFFPSHMLHGVSPHKSDTPRITISGNISVEGTGIPLIDSA